MARDGVRLAVADTGHDRVVVCDLNGDVITVATDLSAPQGIRFGDDDTEVVVCEAGSGRLTRFPLRQPAVRTTLARVTAPFDVLAVPPAAHNDGGWVVADAGGHRLWRVTSAGAVVVAGTGESDRRDGRGPAAALSRPSGLARGPGGTVFVDAGTSALRVLADDGRVATIVAGRPLLHPGGVVAAADGVSVYVADTGHSAVHLWSGVDGELRPVDAPGLDRPGGVDVLRDGRLVVADTGNDRVVVVDVVRGSVAAIEIAA